VRLPLCDLGHFELITQFFFCDPTSPAAIERYLAPEGLALLEAFSESHWRALGADQPRRVLRTVDWPPNFELQADEGVHDGRLTDRLQVRRA